MESKEMRAVFAETLVSLAQADERIVLIDADLGKAAATGSFASAFPTRKINVGVAEANMIGVAAGMASAGKIPFAQTFACFASRRVFDQFFISAAYAHLGVKLIGTDPGIAAAYNGGTHMPFEDIGIMRTVPLLPILEPSDPVSLAALLRASATFEGPTYLRMYRKPLPVRYSRDEKFEIGKSKILHDGGKGAVVLLALGGIMLGEALGAADLLAQEGIATTVIDVLSVKPLDSELLLSLARTAQAMITCENHQRNGGLGSAVAELLAENRLGIPFARIGIQDAFGQVGTEEWLKEHFELSATHIAETVKRSLQ